LKTTHTGQFR